MTDTPQTLPIEIRNRWDGRVLYSTTTAKDRMAAVIEAVNARIDLHQADLSNMQFAFGARLDGARLDGARLDGARLDGASLVGARLVGASLVGARLVGARLVGARLDGASLVGARLDGASLDGARLVGARLDGASLDGASLVGARLVGARLVGASLVGARLVGASLVGASLDGGIVIAKGSLVAYAGPVGDSARTVFAFMAKPDENHKRPWLVLQCGCFTGDSKAYLQRIAERYAPRKGETKTSTAWRAGHLEQCKAALALCSAIAATWTLAEEKAG